MKYLVLLILGLILVGAYFGFRPGGHPPVQGLPPMGADSTAETGVQGGALEGPTSELRKQVPQGPLDIQANEPSNANLSSIDKEFYEVEVKVGWVGGQRYADITLALIAVEDSTEPGIAPGRDAGTTIAHATDQQEPASTHNILVGTGYRTVRLPFGSYRATQATAKGMLFAIRSAKPLLITPSTPKVEVLLEQAGSVADPLDPDHKTVDVLDAATGLHLSNVDFFFMRFPPEPKNQAATCLGPRNAPNPKKIGDPRVSGDSPMRIPPHLGIGHLWVIAPGYTWGLVDSIGSNGNAIVTLYRSGALTIQTLNFPPEFEGFELTLDTVAGKITDACDATVENEYLHVPAGPVNIRLMAPSAFHSGVTLAEYPVTLAQGEARTIVIDYHALPNIAHASLTVTVLRSIPDYEWGGEYLLANPSDGAHPTLYGSPNLALTPWFPEGDGDNEFTTQTYHGLRCGPYTLGISGTSLYENVTLTAGTHTEVEFDLRTLIELEIATKLHGGPTDAEALELYHTSLESQEETIACHWILPIGDTPDLPNHLHLGIPPSDDGDTIRTQPGTIELISDNRNWVFPEPFVEIPPNGPRKVTVPVQYIPGYTVTLLFLHDGKPVPVPSGFVDGFSFHLIAGSDTGKASHQASDLESQSALGLQMTKHRSKERFSAHLQRLGTYELRSSDKRIPTQTIKVTRSGCYLKVPLPKEVWLTLLEQQAKK